jgi:hypothetical protein
MARPKGLRQFNENRGLAWQTSENASIDFQWQFLKLANQNNSTCSP